MKKFIVTLTLWVGILGSIFAQNITYQAVIRDHNQQLVTNKTVRSSVSIHFSDGSRYDTLDLVATTNIQGLLSLFIENEIFFEKNWQNATMSIRVVDNEKPSITYLNAEDRPISSVPYALSVNSKSIQKYLDANHYINGDSIRQTISDSANVLKELITIAGGVKTCDDVTLCVLNELSDNTSETNNAIDTITVNNLKDYLLSNHFYTQNDVNNAIHDSIVNHISQQIKDSIQNSMSAFTIYDCEDVNHCVVNALQNGQSILNQTVDTIIHHASAEYLTNHQYTTQTMVNQTIHDSLSNIHSDVSTLANEISHLVTESNLCQTIENQCTNIVFLDKDNTFTGDNSFSGNTIIGDTGKTTTFNGTVTVPSGFSFNNTCHNEAVNACDLQTVFDSLQRIITALNLEMKEIRDTLDKANAESAPVFSNLTFEPSGNSITATAIFDDNQSSIYEYNFCISLNSDMTSAECYHSTSNVYTFSNLNPNTLYYIKASVITPTDTSSSPTFSQKTN